MNHNATDNNNSWKPLGKKSENDPQSAKINLDDMSYNELIALKESNLVSLSLMKAEISRAKANGFNKKVFGNALWYQTIKIKIQEGGLLDQRIANQMRKVPRPPRMRRNERHERGKADFFMDVAKQGMDEEDFYAWVAEAEVRLRAYRREIGLEEQEC